MGFWIYFGIYTFSLVVIWGFFIIARIHSLKFKNYQPKIQQVTTIATIVLFVFSILGYLFIFISAPSTKTYDIKETAPKSKIQEQIDDFSDLSEKDTDIIPETAGEDYY